MVCRPCCVSKSSRFHPLQFLQKDLQGARILASNWEHLSSLLGLNCYLVLGYLALGL